MTSKAAVDQFLSQQSLAIVGVSRNPQKFGYRVYSDLKEKGYKVFPVNPNTPTIDEQPCYASLAALPEKVTGVVVITPPAQSEQVVKDAAAAGIRHVWLQQGAESAAAVKFCQENGIQVVAGECIFMFAEPTAWFHRAHRWINGVVGKLPK